MNTPYKKTLKNTQEKEITFLIIYKIQVHIHHFPFMFGNAP